VVDPIFADHAAIVDRTERVAYARPPRGRDQMAEGTIKRLTDKGFGFIDIGGGKDLFFHRSAVEGARFEDLQEGQRVSFNAGQGPKGPRAENVKPI
jgi:CspA family cold shock protein